jgi:transcriptional regulator with XRE-family HTH domain
MKDKSRREAPFQPLGLQLKRLREQLKESLAEVSGAVEIDIDNLERMEQGIERPSEDILMLLISHFGIQDTEALELWELAGYDQANGTVNMQFIQDELQSGKQVVMVMALDMRTLYSDSMQTHINKEGVVLQFTQTNGQKHPMPVTRVGMSMEQAQNVVDTLQRALLHAKYLPGPKRLDAPKDSKDNAK